MCGIVGAIARRNVVPILLEGLKRLEYRGYDSAGIAIVNGALKRVRSTGRVAELARRAHDEHLDGPLGIAHTRWATHGVPSERNAHPHVSSGLSVVRNGIIENHEQMRERDTPRTRSEPVRHPSLGNPSGPLARVGRVGVSEGVTTRRPRHGSEPGLPPGSASD